MHSVGAWVWYMYWRLLGSDILDKVRVACLVWIGFVLVLLGRYYEKGIGRQL